jgi:hypothetical protein
MEAHAIGYVHRDLRPRTIYITTRRAKTNFVKLLDFGLAKLVDTDTPVTDGAAAATNLGMTFGDPRYMSPEQARGDRVDRRADIYQLGCVAYEILTGAPPFAGSRVFDILTKQVTESPAPLPERRPGVPLWMEAAVAKMLAKDPENRFATTSRMVEALRRGLDTGEVMEDAIARRRESVPPASVSRVMQRLGIAADGALPPLPAPVAAPAVEVPARRSTGTPKVGVPIVAGAAPAPVVQPPVVGMIEAPRAKRPSVQGDENNVSQVWYDEGDDLDASRAGASRSRASSLNDSLYDEDAPPQGRRWGLIIGVLALLVVGGTVAFALSRGGTKAATTDGSGSDIAAAGIPVDAAPSTILSDVDAAPATPVAVAPTKPVTRTPTKDTTYNGVRPPVVKDSGTPRRPGGPDLGGFAPPGTDPNNGFVPPGTGTPTPPVTNVVIQQPPPPTKPPPGPSGVDNPEDPYGAGPPSPDSPPPDGASGDQKANFFANLGSSQLANGDTTGAAANFKKALELDAKNVPAMLGMGEIALRQGLFGDAIAHLKKAARFAPRNAKAFVLLGEAYLNSGNNAEAATNFKKALQLDPDNARARDGYNEASSRVPPPQD